MKHSSCGLFMGAALLTGVTFFAVDSAAVVYRLADSSACRVTSSLDAPFWNTTTNSKTGTGTGDAGYIELACPIVEDEAVHSRVGATLGVTIDQRSSFPSFFKGCKRLELATGFSCSAQSSNAPLGVQTTVLAPAQLNWTSSQDYPYLYIALSGHLAGEAGNSVKGYWFAKW